MFPLVRKEFEFGSGSSIPISRPVFWGFHGLEGRSIVGYRPKMDVVAYIRTKRVRANRQMSVYG